MSMKNSSDTIWNRTRDLPICSAVPQQLRHRVPQIVMYTRFSVLFIGLYFMQKNVITKMLLLRES
jgi:hypothetical protein